MSILLGLVLLGVLALFGGTIIGMVLLASGEIRRARVRRSMPIVPVKATPEQKHRRAARLATARARSPWLASETVPDLTPEETRRAAVLAAARSRNPWLPS